MVIRLEGKEVGEREIRIGSLQKLGRFPRPTDDVELALDEKEDPRIAFESGQKRGRTEAAGDGRAPWWHIARRRGAQIDTSRCLLRPCRGRVVRLGSLRR